VALRADLDAVAKRKHPSLPLLGIEHQLSSSSDEKMHNEELQSLYKRRSNRQTTQHAKEK
jgi:hypothetical protein